MKVYNSYTRSLEPFVPIEPGRVRMYNCGPTVYGRCHVGNWRTFLFADLLRRWFEETGLQVTQVMNITDVGHLLADAEEGEDKLEAQARRESLDPFAISAKYTEQYLSDRKLLGMRPATVNPRASDHVPQMLAMIDELIDRGYAYVAGEDVYFDVTRFERYGQLSGNRLDDLVAGHRVEARAEKRHPADFALWKSDPKHLMKWPSRFGEHGFPGWHIECSAMAREHLGDQIDVHTGGEDNVFPHHECEIAQTEAITEKPFARYWMHAKFLTVDGGKMAKSLGNIYTLDDVTERGFEPRHLRYALLRGHYRKPIDFGFGALAEARSALEGLSEMRARLKFEQDKAESGSEHPVQAAGALRTAMDHDLLVPEALAAVFELRDHVVGGRVSGAAAQRSLEVLESLERILGVEGSEAAGDDTEIEALIAEREAARASKDWAESDRLRDALDALGVVLQDSAGGTIWRRR